MSKIKDPELEKIVRYLRVEWPKKERKRLKKEYGYDGPLDFSNPKYWAIWCLEYSKAIRPKMEAIDRLLAKSKEKAFTRVVRGCAY